MPIGKIEPFNLSSKQWPAYIRRVNQYILLNDIKDELKVPMLITVVGDETYALMCDLCSPELPESKTYDDLVLLVTQHLEPQRSEIAERHLFRLRRQHVGETLMEYLHALKHLAATCNFGKCKNCSTLDENLRDQFVSGLANDAMRSRIFAEKNVKFKEAVELALALEAAEKHAEVSGGSSLSAGASGTGSGAGEGLHYTRGGRGARARGSGRPAAAGGPGPAERTPTCWRCGKAHRADRCRYLHYNCDECNQRGHLKVMCKQVRAGDRSVRRHNYVSDGEESDDMFNIKVNPQGNKPYFIKVIIDDKDIWCEMDTGSRISAISEDMYLRLFPKKLIKNDNLILRSYSGSRIESLGYIDVNVKLNGVEVPSLPLYVIKHGARPLLGREWLRALEITRINLHEMIEDGFVNQLCAEFPEVFTEQLGTCKRAISLQLTDREPVYVRARPVPLALRPRVERELARLEADGTIYRIDYSEYGTPIVPVVKQNGEIRICGDYKITINPKLQRDHYPLPRIEELFANLSGGQLFTKLDLTHAYEQCLISEESQPFTAITTHVGTFAYRRTPYGLSCVPEKFQKIMEETLRGVPGCVVFLDDICVTGANKREHLSNLRTVLERLRNMGLTIKLSKCTFLQESVKYLGFIINKEGLRPDPTKLEAISSAPTPQNVSQLKSFLGMINFYGKFIPNLSDLLHPLHNLLKKDIPWSWDSSCDRAFVEAKRALLSERVLAHYEEGRPLVLSVDSSAYGLGAVLAHRYPDGSERPVSCVSRTLSAPERNYSQIDKEALAILFGVTKHHQYLFGRRFLLQTDHQPLTHIFGTKGGIPQTAASRLQRWAARLAAYEFDVEYVRSADNGPADALSRLPLAKEGRVTDAVNYVNLVEESLPVSFRDIAKEVEKDHLLSKVKGYIQFGWPLNASCDEEKPYFMRKHDLIVELGCVIYKYRIVIPASLRKSILAEIHEGHLGIVKMKNISRSYVYWPSLDRDLEELCRSCEACRAVRDAPPRAPLHPWEFPLHPWQRLHADFADCAGRRYLIIIDAHSKWIEAMEMRGAVGSQGVSVSTQADIAHSAKGYESEDENAGRKRHKANDDRPASKTTMYSKQEFREQYCINNKQLDLLELEKSKKDRFLGCLSQYHIESPCSRANRASFLSVCVRRRVPSDENLNTDYAPIQRYPRFGQPSPAPPELCAHDADLECSYFRRRPRSVCSQPDPKRYTWMPEDEDFTRMEWPQSVIDDNAGWPQTYNADQIASVTRGGSLPRPPSIIPCPAHTPIPPPPPPPPLTIPPHRAKHVSFARSHTLTTFDDSVMPAAVSSNRFRRDCERLIDGRVMKPEPKPYSTLPIMFQPFNPYPQYMAAAPAPMHYPVTPLQPHAPTVPIQTQTEQPKVVVLDSIKKGVMRTQATQTEVCLGRKPLPPNYLSLSPRTIKRVKMVAAGVQTNGITVGPRRLTKSFSEVGGERLADRDTQNEAVATIESFIGAEHEKVHRTQSEEPPKSPCSPISMVPTSPRIQRGDSEDNTSSPIKSVASSLIDKSSELSALQRQAQEYFQQNFQFIHESDRDDTIDDDIETIEKSMALNRRNLEYLQQEIAKQTKGERSLKSILSKSTSDTSQKTINSQQFSKTSFHSEPSTETSVTTTDESEKNEKEIIIDFEPRPDDEAIPFTTLRRNRRLLQKTLSEGEILLDVRKTEIHTNGDGVKDAPLVMSTSQENMTREDREREAIYIQYIGQNYSQTPIKDEGIFGFEPDGSYSSSDGNAPYEDFHEKYISYKHDSFRIRSVSFEEQIENVDVKKDVIPVTSTAKSSPGSPEPVSVNFDIDHKTKRAIVSKIANTLTPLDKMSPCASNESLTVDPSRDHSDGMWNESQTTVLQVDSGTENGTVVSSSDLSSLATSPGALALLTPTSRRKQLLLLQHQQRSSLDTDALDEEFDASQSQSPTSPRNKLETSSSSSQARISLSPPAVVPNVTLPITKQPMTSKHVSSIAPTKVNHTPAIAITHPSLDLADVPFKRTPSFINKKRERALSPSRRRDLQSKTKPPEHKPTVPPLIAESPSESASLSKAGSSETNLARTDSGKTNTTDVSESTTTTEDYVTANSDSSKKSGKNQNHNPENNKAQEGSSFESASSLYSTTRNDNITEDLIVPSFSPPLQINDDFIVSNLTSPPLPLPDRISKIAMEKIEVKADITPSTELIRRDKTDKHKTSENITKTSTTRDVVSGKSSSSGSYSIGGSHPNMTEDMGDKTPTNKTKQELDKMDQRKNKEDQIISPISNIIQRVPKMTGSLSDDERSVHYSSSGYYESPVDDDDDGGLTYRHSQKYRSSQRQKTWMTDDKRRKKKAFTLEFSKSYDDSVSTSQDDWSKIQKDNDSISQRSERSALKGATLKSPPEEKIPDFRKKKTHFADKTKGVQSSPRESIDVEKAIKDKLKKEKDLEPKRLERERYVKRTKLKAKSPTQSKPADANHSYRPQIYDRRDSGGPNMKLHLNIPTSDDSSEQYRKDGPSNGNISPRKHRRLRDSPRRKTAQSTKLACSPITSNNHASYSCRPRRKSASNESISLPGSLPRRKQSIPIDTGLNSLEAEDIETTKVLTSAGSRLTPLRYINSSNSSPRHHRKQEKEGKFAKAASAESLRSVSPGSDSVFYSEQTEHSFAGADGEAKAHCLHCGKEVHIVTASHEHDSMASRTSHTDESYADATPDIVPAPAGFADSPNCTSSKKSTNGARLYKKLEKRYRSEDKSRHHRHRQDVRAKSEERGKEEYAACEKTQDTRIARSAGNSLDKLAGSSGSVDPDEQEECSVSSEGADGSRNERGVYAAPWWCGNWILLSECDDIWTRIPPDVVDTGDMSGEDPTESETEFNKRYVALTHRLVHRRACIELNRRQSENTFESDKTVVVRRGNEEFGFRIHGSKPVVVSAIEPDTPAETSGLEVGDIVIAVNGINVLDKTHSEVVKIAHSGSEILELEVARTCEVVASLAHESGPAALYSGYLWRAAPLRPHHPPRWTRRWFVLKRDNCLYYYKTDSSIHPVGALMLVNYQLTEEDAGRPHGFRLQRGGGNRLQLAADTAEAAARWSAVLAHAIDTSNQRDGWLDVTMRNMKLPPSSIPRPDCFGYLMKLGSKWKSWAKRYCVLKDACLYFYSDGNSKNAFGMACLHGYRVQTCAPGGKKYAFEVMPTEPKQRHFYFHTESEMDRKRWMAALEYSIDRWMKSG